MEVSQVMRVALKHPSQTIFALKQQFFFRLGIPHDKSEPPFFVPIKKQPPATHFGGEIFQPFDQGDGWPILLRAVTKPVDPYLPSGNLT